jgi:hypothetical protein
MPEFRTAARLGGEHGGRQRPSRHFACHGLWDWANPAASRLLLTDHDSAPLTVTALMRLHLADADLAYLSACSTTLTSQALADEAVHLTAAVHLAGYRQVIGTCGRSPTPPVSPPTSTPTSPTAAPSRPAPKTAHTPWPRPPGTCAMTTPPSPPAGLPTFTSDPDET